MTTENDDMLCYCGTETEAIAAARKLYAQMAGTDCPTWALGVATALRSIAIEQLVYKDVPRNILMYRCNIITDRVKNTIVQEEVDSEVKIHRTKLHGHS